MIELTETWRRAFPGAVIGALVLRGVRDSGQHDELDRLRDGLELELRERFPSGGRDVLKTDPIMAVYGEYYGRFRKTYHVSLQLESILWKGRRISSGSAVVQAMFMAELSNGLLTAGHDCARLAMPVRVGVATGESYVTLGGQERVTKAGDMIMSDRTGVISSIVYGPDQRTCLSAGIEDVLFTVYAPAGIGQEAVRGHLRDIERFVRVVSPGARAEMIETLTGGEP